MGKFEFRRKAVAEVSIAPRPAGNRALFMVEIEGKRERRQARELFDTVAELAEVAQLCDGTLVAFAVQVHGDTSLFAKIEWLLRSQFSFSVVERSVNATTYRLLESLCSESDSRLVPLSRCGICEATDPFPTRVTLRDESNAIVLEATYCASCAADRANRDVKKLLIGLLEADRRDLSHIRQARLVCARRATPSRDADRASSVRVYAVAS